MFICIGLLLGLAARAEGKPRFERAVREAVTRQMAAYPQSTLKDLYKNFFQDRFGPGHIIADTAAGSYLRWELFECEIAPLLSR